MAQNTIPGIQRLSGKAFADRVKGLKYEKKELTDKSNQLALFLNHGRSVAKTLPFKALKIKKH